MSVNYELIKNDAQLPGLFGIESGILTTTRTKENSPSYSLLTAPDDDE
jgi:hypothetical protein